MICMLLFNFVNYVFLFLCMFRSECSVSLCCSVYCLCVNVYCSTATGCLRNYSEQIYVALSQGLFRQLNRSRTANRHKATLSIDWTTTQEIASHGTSKQQGTPVGNETKCRVRGSKYLQHVRCLPSRCHDTARTCSTAWSCSEFSLAAVGTELYQITHPNWQMCPLRANTLWPLSTVHHFPLNGIALGN